MKITNITVGSSLKISDGNYGHSEQFYSVTAEISESDNPELIHNELSLLTQKELLLSALSSGAISETQYASKWRGTKERHHMIRESILKKISTTATTVYNQSK